MTEDQYRLETADKVDLYLRFEKMERDHEAEQYGR